MTRVGMHEAKSQLSKLVERVEAGEEIVTRRGPHAPRSAKWCEKGRPKPPLSKVS